MTKQIGEKLISPSTLYVVATPIGNLEDISLRAIDILKQVDMVLAEDTRHSQKLFSRYGILTQMRSCHEHNEDKQTEFVLQQLAQAKSLALISDAGTPLVSDPGYQLIRQVAEQGYCVSPVPGACAAIAALCVSGLPSDEFRFIGFLAAKSSKRIASLTRLKYDAASLIIYESPHRLLASLKDMAVVFGADRRLSLARELSKRFETVLRGSIAQVSEQVEADADQQKGEFVLVVEGNKNDKEPELVNVELLLRDLLQDVSLKRAAEIAAKHSQYRKNELYQLALTLVNK